MKRAIAFVAAFCVLVACERKTAPTTAADQSYTIRALVTALPNPPKGARFDIVGGGERVAFGFTPKGDGKATVALEHSKLPDQASADAAKVAWRARLDALKRFLEG